jgi:hypothetical protein
LLLACASTSTADVIGHSVGKDSWCMSGLLSSTCTPFLDQSVVDIEHFAKHQCFVQEIILYGFHEWQTHYRVLFFSAPPYT